MKNLIEEIQIIEKINALELRRIVIDWSAKKAGFLFGGGNVDADGIFTQTKTMPLEFDKNRSLAPDEKSFDEMIEDILGIPAATIRNNILNYGETYFRK